MITQTVRGAFTSVSEDAIWSNRLRAVFTQENITTIVVSLIVAVAVVLPLVTLFVSSFLVLDDLGFDTEWGFGNYVTLVTDLAGCAPDSH